MTNQIIGIYFISCGITTGPTVIFINKESNKESSNSTIITQNEEDYKKILLSIISSLNKLEITSNDNEPEAIKDSVDIMNNLSTENSYYPI